MKEQKEILRNLNINKSWTLFLDRDGVINKKIEGDYVRSWEQFELLPNVIEALKILSSIFGKIIIVTNQRGIGRGLITEKDLNFIHNKMLNIFCKEGIKIDKIYHCPHDYEKQVCDCRKPKIGMALQAKKDFPGINFSNSIMVGDSISDMEFGNKLGMILIYISNIKNSQLKNLSVDYIFSSLYDFAIFLEKSTNQY